MQDRRSRLVVFDLETVGLSAEELGEHRLAYLMRGAESDEEQESVASRFALNPFTAKIVTIGAGVYDVSTSGSVDVVREGVLQMTHDGREGKEQLSDGTTMALGDEKSVINGFWSLLEHYRGAHLVSFNGRGFDAPFLMLRSAVHRIRPIRDLMSGTKFNYPLHTDLADELAFYSFSKDGPSRRFNFDFYMKSFGLTSPKEEGVDGSMVGDLFAKGEERVIAEYCLRDVRATLDLYMFWNEFLNFK